MSILSAAPSLEELSREATAWCEAGFIDRKDGFVKHALQLTQLRLAEKGIYVPLRDHEAEYLDRTRELEEIGRKELELAERLGSLRDGGIAAWTAAVRLLALVTLLATDVGVMIMVCADYLGIDLQRGLFTDRLPGFIASSLGMGLTFVTVLLAERAITAWDETPPYDREDRSRVGRVLPAAILVIAGIALAALRTDQSAGSWFFSIIGVLALPVAAALLQQKFDIGKADTQRIREWVTSRAERRRLRRDTRALRADRRSVRRECERLRDAATQAARGQTVIDKAMVIVGTRAELSFERAAANLRPRKADRAEVRLEREGGQAGPWPRRFGVS